MSKTGDVVWADGKSWQRDDDHANGPKEWWIAPKSDPSTLQALKEHSDFRWLVKDGELVDEMYYEGKLDAWETAKLILGFTDKHQSFAHALDDQRKQAAQAERAAIVAWLRSDDIVDIGPEMTLILAGCIERGQHLEDDTR